MICCDGLANILKVANVLERDKIFAHHILGQDASARRWDEVFDDWHLLAAKSSLVKRSGEQLTCPV